MSVEALTDRQHQILVLLAEGCTDRGIARRLNLSPCTVHNHVEQVRRRLGADNRAHAVGIGYRAGLLKA